MARKFLYFIALVITLVLAAGVGWFLYAPELIRIAMTPSEEFKAPAPAEPSIYADPKMWIARPELANNPALWQPERKVAPAKGDAAIFFIHPTSYLDRRHWNAPLDDEEANDRAELFVRGQASTFAHAGDVWAPKYRQATFGAFLTTDPRGLEAIEAAYGDVKLAFDAFVQANPKKRIILAGHSQGALHLTHLLQDRIAGQAIAKRIVAAYVIGWPISIAADLPALGLPACTTPTQTGCILSWQSYAEPADTSQVEQAFDAAPSLTGTTRLGSPYLCTNPLTGGAAPSAEADKNLGTLHNNADFSGGELVAKAVPARCNERGFLLIGDPPTLGPYVLPGNNYHVYDFSLFWANISDDALARVRG